MKLRKAYILALIWILLSISIGCVPDKKNLDNFPEVVKVAMRNAGNQLLLSHKDSTSLILPIIEVEKNRYQLSFESHISIDPDNLTNSISSSFENSNLPSNYIVEVINCNNKQVSYSYFIGAYQENNIVPCIGRNLPVNCYKINVLFLENESYFASLKKYAFIFLILITCLGFGVFYYQKKRKNKNTSHEIADYITLGDYKFYNDQHKLVKEDQVIKLTSKECELIKIFSQNQNQIIKREFLIKEVWENNGVVVGRSLDAFISRIRKKLENDSSLNLVNVHGVGYKLEVS